MPDARSSGTKPATSADMRSAVKDSMNQNK
jgi:hypothetical protein